MTSTNTAAFSGHSNRGFQVGFNSGPIHVNIPGQPDGSLTKPTPSSSVPFRRDPDFVDRDILAEVHMKCSRPASRAALVGLGGVGKSQLAIEYSYQIREQSPQTWIFWVHASNAARFEEGYRMIADRINLPRRDEPTADVLQLVSKWLRDEANGRWIIILDNADDPTVFSDPRKGRLKSELDGSVTEAVSLSTFLPQTPNGSILVTSRSQDAASRLIWSHHDIIKVEPMDKSCALLLLGKKVGGEFDEDDAIELLHALDYMPLAISQAAAYISQRTPRTTVSRYLETFRKSDRNRANLLNRDAGDLRRDNQASNSIVFTWQISFEYIRSKRPSAARLLSLMSFFDRQGIPEFLLRRYYDSRDNSRFSDFDMKANADIDLKDDSDLEFEDDICTLTNYSLITTNVKEDQFEMHRLVQLSTRKWLELNSELEKWKEKYIEILLEAFPVEAYENWTTCRMLFPHAEALLAYQPTETRYLLYWSDVLDKAGQYAAVQGNYLMAEEMNKQALKEREKALGKGHPDTLTSVNNLALVLQDQGKFKAAEDMNRRVLDVREKVLGNQHPDTLTTLNNLALVLRYQGKYEAAEDMNRRVLDVREKVLGNQHPDTLTTLNNLASVLQDHGKYEAAEDMNRRVLDGSEKVLGNQHPDTLTTLNNLAGVLRYQGKYEAAEDMNRRVLDVREKVLGNQHPDTLTSVSNLAGVLRYQGKYEAAEDMNRRVLDVREKVLGNQHPDTLTTLNNLASVLRYQGKYEAAEDMNRRVLDVREKVLGNQHPDTLTSVSNLAGVLQDQGKYEAAEDMNRRVLDGSEKSVGKGAPPNADDPQQSGVSAAGPGEVRSSRRHEPTSAGREEKTMGKEHPDTLLSDYCLASLFHEQK